MLKLCHHRQVFFSLILLLAVGVFAPGVASAQDATIAGTVTDTTGGILPGVTVGRCCTNRDWPARCPPTGSSPVEAIRHWSAEGGHPIEDLTAEDDLTPLPGWAPGPEVISDNGLVSEERVLHPALTMVP